MPVLFGRTSSAWLQANANCNDLVFREIYTGISGMVV